MPTALRHHAAGLVKAMAPDGLVKARRTRHFFESRGWQNLHLGEFADFATAQHFAEQRGAITRYAIDHQDWLKARHTLRAHDYPVLYWLGKLLRWDPTLVDFGGSVGATYYAYRERLDLPADFVWTVCEMPETAQLGRTIATERGETKIAFTDDCASLDGCGVMLAAGVVQLIDGGLPALLRPLSRKPQHLLVNRIPLCHDRPGFVTLQNTGQSISPLRVENHDDFLADLHGLGYQLIDRWKCLENSMHVPDVAGADLSYFDGFYLHRAD